MAESQLLQEVGQKEADKEEITDRVIEDSRLLSEIFEGLSSDKIRIKYGCVNILRIISEKKPEIIYPKFDFFINLLDSDNTFLKWGAIYILANLAAVDSENQFERVFDKYFAPIPGPVLITAANVVGGAARIALAKPELTEIIPEELFNRVQLRVADNKHKNKGSSKRTYMLMHLGRCGECGGRLYCRMSKGHRYHYIYCMRQHFYPYLYHCFQPKNLNLDWIEDYIWAEVEDLLENFRDSTYDLLLDRFENAKGDREKQIAKAKEEVDRCNEERQRVLTIYRKKYISEAEAEI